MKSFIFLILVFEICMIKVFLVIHTDTKSGLRTHLKLTARLGCAVMQVTRRDLSGQIVSHPPGSLDPPGNIRCQG